MRLRLFSRAPTTRRLCPLRGRRRAGTSIGLTYRYFHNKGALAAAVVEDFFDRLDEAVLHAPIEAADWAARERRRIELMVAFHFAEPLAAVALGALAREPEVAAVLVERNANLAAVMAANLARGQDLGMVSEALDPTIAGPMMMGAIRDALRVGLTAGEHLSAAMLTAEILRFVTDACGIRAPESS